MFRFILSGISQLLVAAFATLFVSFIPSYTLAYKSPDISRSHT